MVDSVAPVIRPGRLAVMVALLVASPADAKTTTHTWRVGPVDMRGYATEQALQDTRAPRMRGYLTAMHARIVDAAGRPVPQERVMLHHVFFVNHGRFRGDRGVHELSRTWTVPRSGRIVAGAAHAHGGALNVDVADERCGGRQMLSSDARYGLAEDPIYNLSPVLHEPAPRSMSVATSVTGWGGSRGGRPQ